MYSVRLSLPSHRIIAMGGSTEAEKRRAERIAKKHGLKTSRHKLIGVIAYGTPSQLRSLPNA